MKEVTIISTSKSSAKCTDIELRVTSTTRLIFRPMLVENRKNPSAAVKGVFVFQRKGLNDQWEDLADHALSTLKKGEGYKLELHSSELLAFYDELNSLYKIHTTTGIPFGEKHFMEVSPHLYSLVNLNNEELIQILDADIELGSDLFNRLLSWTLSHEEPKEVVTRLTNIDPSNIQRFNVAIGIQSMKIALDEWNTNFTSSDEELWQRLISQHSYILEYLFSWPSSIVAGKAYVGGKSVFNKSGSIVDFLIKNSLTRNAALIEIKTPATQLLSKEYRNGIFNLSTELTGSLMQVLNYKHTLENNYFQITKGQQDIFNSFDPQCVVIIGNCSNELDTHDKKKTFELFRAQMNDVSIITYDELFQKTQNLIDLLEGDNNNDDLPF